MSSVATNNDEKLAPGRIVATIALALLALVCFGESARYLLSQQHHLVRVAGSFILGVIFVIGAWFALRYQSLAAEEAREAQRIAATESVTGAALTMAAEAPDTQATPTQAPDTPATATEAASPAQQATTATTQA